MPAFRLNQVPPSLQAKYNGAIRAITIFKPHDIWLHFDETRTEYGRFATIAEVKLIQNYIKNENLYAEVKDVEKE
jgi:hypothetical protein